MQSNLLYYLWSNSLYENNESNTIVSLSGTTDIREDMCSFKAIKHMLQDVDTLKPKDNLKLKEPETMRALDFMWHTPNDLNTMFDTDNIWYLKDARVDGDDKILLNQHKEIYQQVKRLGYFTDVQKDKNRFTLQKMNTTELKKSKKHPIIRVFVDDDSDVDFDIEEHTDSEYEEYFSSDDVYKTKNIPMCVPKLKKYIVGKDTLICGIMSELHKTPNYFQADKSNKLVYVPYFEDLDDREELETLMHYYKSKADELDIDAMKPGKSFIVEKEVDKLYKDMYDKGGKFEKKVNRVIARLNDNPSYQLWEQEYVAICKQVTNRYSIGFKEPGVIETVMSVRKRSKNMQYQMNLVKEHFTQWLKKYKTNNYVPYKFLIKYFK